MGRIIGVRHRVKRTANNEMRPTMVAIKENGSVRIFELEDDESELDFVIGKFPTSWRNAHEGEDLSSFLRRHVRRIKKKNESEVIRVPASYDGLKAGDTVAMSLGGSGDLFAFALSRRGEKIGAEVWRVPPFILKERRRDASKDDDHMLLANLIETSPALFYRVNIRARDLIAERVACDARRDAMKDRIRCEQRLFQRMRGKIFLADSDGYPNGKIKDIYDAEKASDTILRGLLEEEKNREEELKRIVRELRVWKEVFAPVEGCGEIIAAGLIAAIGDISRFPTAAKFKKYCGVHVMKDWGDADQPLFDNPFERQFPRRRAGTIANWAGVARQCFFLLGEQFNYRSDSIWGRKLREYKVKFRTKHPEVIVVDGKRRYTDGHIHKMAMWRTRTKFAEWLWRKWSRLESGSVAFKKAV